MSSHHIIKDEQEPPVLVFQLNGNWEKLSELLGWSPILLINPSLKETFDIKQTKIDGYLLKGDETIVNSKHGFLYSEESLVEALSQWIDLKKCTAVNIFCHDKTMMELYTGLKKSRLSVPLIFFTETGKFILKPNSKFKKWYPEEFKIDILNEDIKSIRNLIEKDKGYYVEMAGFVTIEVEGNMVLIKEN